MIKNQKGITLIALVITIIVLLILATISIVSITSDQGIVKKANTAKIKTSHGSVKEGMIVAYDEYKLEMEEKSLNNNITNSELVQRPTIPDGPLTEMSKVESNYNGAELVKTNSNRMIGVTTDAQEKLSSGTGIDESLNFYSFKDYCIEKGYCDANGKINVKKVTGKDTGFGNGTGSIDVYKLTDIEEITYTEGGANDIIGELQSGNKIELKPQSYIVNKLALSQVGSDSENNDEISSGFSIPEKCNYTWQLKYYDKTGNKEELYSLTDEFDNILPPLQLIQ